jgi:hypothetical protein
MKVEVVIRAGAVAARLFAVAFGCVWLAVAGSMMAMVGGGFFKQLHFAWACLPAPATVTSLPGAAGPERDTDGGEDQQPGSIGYKYLVGGKEYSGRYAPPDGQAATSQNGYRPSVAALSATGQRITAWYDPAEPSISTLDPSVEPAPLGMLMFLMPFAAVGLAMVFGALVGGIGNRPARPQGTPLRRVLGVVYFVLSCGGGLAFIIASQAMPWRSGLALGFAMWLAGIPLATLAVAVVLRRLLARRAKPSADGPPAATLQPDPASALGADGLPPLRRKLLGVALFALVWCGITGVFVGFVVYGFIKQADAAGRFRATLGTVTASEVVVDPGDSDSGPTYAPRITYRYTVDDRNYTSSRYAYGMVSHSGHKNVQRLVADHPPGKAVTVYYDPRRPGESVLDLAVPAQNWLLVLFLQPFVLVGLGMLGYLLTLPGSHRRLRQFVESAPPLALPADIPTWGVLAPGPGGLTVIPRGGLGRVAAGFAVGYGVAIFLSLFVVGLLLGGFDDPGPANTFGAMAVAAAIGLAAAAMAARGQRSKATLALDTQLGELSLTGPRRASHARFADIACWELRDVANPHRTRQDSDTPTAPLLVARLLDGSDLPVHVFAATAEGRMIAHRAGLELAAMTGHQLTVALPPPNEPTAGDTNIRAVMERARSQAAAAKALADLT